ncbi:MAG: phosphatidate cytidylyltransferase [Actinomycetaceae bacterium]|nr:phosphatidate cytidylyltransferase [Actinomycetaceae bacterium]
MASSSSFLARLRPHPPAPPEQSASKAGRNLWKAVPTALISLAIVAACVLWRIELFVALVCVALCVAVWEAAGAFLVKNIRVPYVLLILLTLVMVIGTWFWGVKVALLVFLIACLLFYLRFFLAETGDKKRAESSASILILAWISLLGSFAAGLTTLDKAVWLVALLILLPAANDTGGWLAGVLFGKHPMAPKISPKKSWEGLAGSLILTIAIALAIVSLALKQPWWVGVLYGVLAVIASTGGDLVESVIKRRLGIKDMGTLFPGHGGMLDRVDSILMWAPVCYILSLIFLNS